MHCTGWNNYSYSEKVLSKMQVLLPVSIFRFYQTIRMSFTHKSVREKIVFQSACFCWDSRFSLRGMDQNFKFGEPLVIVTRTWSSCFVTSKYLDYMQYYMMLLEQCGHIVVKVPATVTWLKEDQVHCFWSPNWITLLPLRRNASTFHFQLCRLLKQTFMPCTRYWASRFKQ